MDISKILAEYRQETTTNYIYGTAGFRRKAHELSVIVFRMGVLAVLRSKAKRAVIGIMITASHNPEEDNGVKLIDPHGEMLEQSWEEYATLIANASDADLPAVYQKIETAENIGQDVLARVYCAYDTRPSSVSLHEAAKIGVATAGGSFSSYGVLTTPQLHYLVRCENTGTYGAPDEAGYYEKLAGAFMELNQPSIGNKAVVFVDGANGVGAVQLEKLAVMVEGALKINIVNCGEGKLNHDCGADHVKLLQKAPVIYTPMRAIEPEQRWASLDGDADRLVYYYIDQGGVFHLLDGDKIATLIALYVGELVQVAELSKDKASIGIVQTAYANGSSTKYIEDVLKLPVFCVPTGVKHLHKKAHELDIGVYFEANGHGTVLFSDHLKQELASELLEKKGSPERLMGLKKLKVFIDLVNETVGDAMADLLIVETILIAKGWTIMDWDALYTDLPYRQLKVAVKDRSVITTTDAERRCVTPEGLQERIDALVVKYNSARAFVRPSGTEDVVRVLAEADTAEAADKLANEVAEAVREIVG